jgi:PAS domain S-box-containing protein
MQRAKGTLPESAERLRRLADELPQIVWANAATGEADYFNRRWYEYCGLSYEESFGLGWQRLVHPDDAPASVERWQQAMAAGDVFDVEYRLRRKDGAYRWHIGRNVPARDSEGRIISWFGTATDIQDLKEAEASLRESEERFRLLVEGASDHAMFLLDPEHRITFWSTGAERVFGWSADEALGQDGSLIFTPEDRERGVPEQECHQAKTEGRALDKRWHIRKDGSVIWCDGVMSRLDHSDGSLRGFAKVARDATGEREAADALQRAHDELERRVMERTTELLAASEQRARLLQQLVSAQEEERWRLSRELHDQTGQPLAGIQIGLETLRSTLPVGSPSIAVVDQLQAVAARLSQDLHHLAWELRPPALDDLGLPGTLGNYLQDWQERAGIEADFHTRGLEQKRLTPAVETALYRIVQEALTNVARHSRARRVSVVLERQDHQAILIVEDDGVGFDPDAATERLGLRGMEERIAALGGTLETESSPGQGSTLFARLPLQTGDGRGRA